MQFEEIELRWKYDLTYEKLDSDENHNTKDKDNIVNTLKYKLCYTLIASDLLREWKFFCFVLGYVLFDSVIHNALDQWTSLSDLRFQEAEGDVFKEIEFYFFIANSSELWSLKK